MNIHTWELRNLLEQKKKGEKNGHQNPKRDSGLSTVLLSRRSNEYLSQGRNCSAMRLIHLLVIVPWVRFRSSRVFEVRTFWVARLLSTQIKLVSDHLRVCLYIGNSSRCLEALQKVREAGVHMWAHFLLSSPLCQTMNGKNNWNFHLKRCEWVFVERPLGAADGGNFLFTQSLGTIFFPTREVSF